MIFVSLDLRLIDYLDELIRSSLTSVPRVAKWRFSIEEFTYLNLNCVSFLGFKYNARSD